MENTFVLKLILNITAKLLCFCTGNETNKCIFPSPYHHLAPFKKQTSRRCVMVSELCDRRCVNVCGGNQPRETGILWDAATESCCAPTTTETQHELCMLSNLRCQINQPLYGSTSWRLNRLLIEQLPHAEAGFTEQQGCVQLQALIFFSLFHSPVRSYQAGIWETLDKIDAGLVKYWSLMARTSGVHLDRVVAGERQATVGWQQTDAAWPIPFFIVANSVPALFSFPNRHSNHVSP